MARSFSRPLVVAPDGQAKENHISEPRINDRIRVPEVRLVGPNGEQVGIVRVEDALRLAAESDLDLVEVAPMAKPPVAKLMDFGKFKYEAAIKEREARKNQVNTVIKEIKLRPKIDPHDYATKKGHVERFLKTGDKVKVTIMFRGREQSRPELGYRLLQRLAEDIGDLGFVESTPKQDGRNMVMVIGPTKKKAEAKAEQRRKREEGASNAAAATAAASKATRPTRQLEGDRSKAARLDRRQHALARDAAAAPGNQRCGPQDRGRDHRRRVGRSTALRQNPRAPRGPALPKEIGSMPKMKTHSGAKKRFRLTGTGKVMREQAGGRHLLEHKSSKKTRSIANDVELNKPQAKKIKKLLGK